VRTSEVEMSLY